MSLPPLLVLALLSTASADDIGHFSPPGSALAGADGTTAHWVNPANLGFDPDRTSDLYIFGPRDFSDSNYVMTAGSGGSSFGAIHRRTAAGDRYWAISQAGGFALGDRLRMGSFLQWNWGGEREGWATMDFGVSYRPTSWLGFGAVARNAVGDRTETPATYETGLVLRPAGDLLLLGADYTLPAAGSAISEGVGVASLAIQAPSGLTLRGQVDTDLGWGAGLEVHFGGAGFSAFSEGVGEQLTYGFLTSQPNQGAQISAGSDVPYFNLGKSYAYEPTAGLFSEAGGSYLDLLRRLRKVADDDQAETIILTTSGLSMSYAQLQELRSILMDARDAGKKLVFYLGDWASLKEYYLASTGTHIAIHPGASLMFTGIGMERMYFAGTLDLVGVEPQFSQQGDYKSAVEQYTRTGASDYASEQDEALLDDLWTSLVAGIAHARGISEEEVVAAIDAGPMTADTAKAQGWVDELTYKTQFKRQHIGDSDADSEAGAIAQNQSGWADNEEVAVIYITGPIMSGRSARGGILGGSSTGSDTIVSLLKKARDNDQIKALVLRVDSPGGSASASEDIWNAVKEVQAAGKPVVVSMGGVAASGGYYVSASADAILAEPTTITGSIGAFAGRFSFGELYERIGISTELSGRGRMANMFASSKPMDPVEWANFDALANDVYQRFLQTVAEGRDMSVEDVEAVASGRVWSGEDAVEQGLVDQLGGFEEALDLAAEKAGLEDRPNIRTLGADLREDLREELLRSLEAPNPLIDALPTGLVEMMRYEGLVNENVFLMMPYHLSVH
ncbi:MAG: signal peptide peptidase SppA [Myxococcota bacterium]|nr:signal peptide peptidase SppA [Myxococcota bacterium]